MGRYGEDGVLEQVFPIARERATRGHDGAPHARQATVGDHQNPLLRLERVRIAKPYGRRAELRRGAHQAEAGLVVIGDDVGGHRLSARTLHRHRRGLENEVADGEHEAAVIDDDAVALASAAKSRGRARVRRNLGAESHHGGDHVSQRLLGAARTRPRHGRCQRPRQKPALAVRALHRQRHRAARLARNRPPRTAPIVPTRQPTSSRRTFLAVR